MVTVIWAFSELFFYWHHHYSFISIKDHWSQITIRNTTIMKNLKHCENYQNVTKIQEERRCCWINDTDRLARCRVGINLWFVKHSVCTKCNKAKSHQVRWIIVLTTQISLLNPHQITVEKVPIFMLLMRMLRQKSPWPITQLKSEPRQMDAGMCAPHTQPVA